MIHEIHKKLFDNELIADISISYLNHATKVTDELLDILASLSITGLKKITFDWWSGGMESKLNSAVIDRLSQKTINLRQLVVSNM